MCACSFCMSVSSCYPKGHKLLDTFLPNTAVNNLEWDSKHAPGILNATGPQWTKKSGKAFHKSDDDLADSNGLGLPVGQADDHRLRLGPVGLLIGGTTSSDLPVRHLLHYPEKMKEFLAKLKKNFLITSLEKFKERKKANFPSKVLDPRLNKTTQLVLVAQGCSAAVAQLL